MAKLDILSPSERKTFDTPPKLTPAERDKIFELPEEIKEWMKTLGSEINQVGFYLIYGYCKHSGRFFSPKTFHTEDIVYTAQQLNLSVTIEEFKQYPEKTYRNHKNAVRTHLKLLPFNKAGQEIFRNAIHERVSRRQLPKQIFMEVTALLKTSHIEIPGYNRFALAITDTIAQFEKTLLEKLTEQFSSIQCEKLDELLKIEPETGLSALAQLKTISHSNKPAAIRKSMKKFHLVQTLYQQHEGLLQKFNLHIETIKHYATWVRKSSLQQITQLIPSKRYLHLLSFIAHQYRVRQDFLGDMFLSCTKYIQNTVIKKQKTLLFESADTQHKTFRLLSESRITYKSLLSKIQSIVKSVLFSDTEKVKQISELIDAYHAQSPIEPQLDALQKQAQEEMAAQNYYTLLETLSIKLQNRVSDILKYLQFDITTTNLDLLAAIQHYQLKSGIIGKEAPQAFLHKTEAKALWDNQGKFRISLYKALLFLNVAENLKSGILSLAPAYRYLTLDAYLHSATHWQMQKENLLTQTELVSFQNINTVLSQLRNILHDQYGKTNNRIKKNQNAYLKFDSKNKLILKTPKIDKINTQSVSVLFSECKYVSILQVLSDINRVTDYLSCLTHFSVKDKKVLPRKETFYAAILGQGCNIGTSKMAIVSKGISEKSLSNIINWHLSLDSLYAANNKVLAFLEQLSLSAIYKKSQKQLHTSSDGRKVSVAVDSLNANCSFKYFGEGIGSSIYSFIDERNRIFYSTVISASEREAAYVIDGLLHNLAIKSNIHSTDTHGYSEAVFAVMHLLGIFFAPRIKNLKKCTLYSFKSKKVYENNGYKILPERYIDEKLIESNWEDILRLMVTLKLKETTASQIFKRLSSYSKQHPLYCAIKEFGRIIKSIFILRYMDEVGLRQAIEKQLNRVELSNKFSKAIMFGSNQEIQYSSKEEQELAVSCQRFIQNAIILWNELYLSQKLSIEEDADQRKTLLDIIRLGSTMLWGHINLHGEYDFTKDIAANDFQFDMEKILALKVA